MPELIVPPGFASVRVIFGLDGKPDPMMVTFGVRLTAGVSDPEDVADEIHLDWVAAFAPAELDANYAVVGVSVTLGQDGGPGPTGDNTTRSGGARAGSAPPPNCCVLVRKRTALGGRRNRGRMYLPAGYLLEGDVDENGGIAAGALTTLQASTDAFRVAVLGGTNYDAMVILHSAAPTTPTVITSTPVDNTIATQRQRLRK